MIARRAAIRVDVALARQAAVALIGPRQSGKTTLALDLAARRPSQYLDLELPEDRAKLADAVLFLRDHRDRLVILDEIHRVPELFQPLRGLIDEGRRSGRGNGRFLLLGSASMDLLRQSGESLAGRIEYVSLGPFDCTEVEGGAMRSLWLRGGFPGAFLVPGEPDSLAWRRNFILSYLERDIPQFGKRIPAETLRRFWTMLAHEQGALLNASKLGASLAVQGRTVAGYIDLFCDLLLVRRLAPYHANVKKRLVKSPKVYVRDSGLLHALLGIGTFDQLVGHPILGASWEGFAIENLLAGAPPGTEASFYRTSAGSEVDLVLQLPGEPRPWIVEIKHGLAPGLGRGFREALADLGPARAFVIYSGVERYPLADGVEAIGLRELCGLLARMFHAAA